MEIKFSVDYLINPMFIESSLRNYLNKRCNKMYCKRKGSTLYICRWGKDICLLNLCDLDIRKIDQSCKIIKKLDTKDIFTLQILNE